MFSLPDNIFSLESGIYICFGTVLGSLISGGLLLINNSRNNDFQLKREREQIIWQEESDKQKWYREQIYDTYRKAIHLLTKIIQSGYEMQNYGVTPDRVRDINNLYVEFGTEFYIIVMSHPDKDCEKFKEKSDEILDFKNTQPTFARLGMIEIMENDPRIKDVNKKYLNSEKSLTQSS